MTAKQFEPRTSTANVAKLPGLNNEMAIGLSALAAGQSSWRSMKSRCLISTLYLDLARPARLGGLSCVPFPSTHVPADDPRFDWAASIHTVPSTATPSAQKRNDIGTDVIFAKKFKWPVRRRNTLVSEGVDSLLPCRHAVRSRLSLSL